MSEQSLEKGDGDFQVRVSRLGRGGRAGIPSNPAQVRLDLRPASRAQPVTSIRLSLRPGWKLSGFVVLPESRYM